MANGSGYVSLFYNYYSRSKWFSSRIFNSIQLRLVNGENIDIEHMPFTCGLIDLNTKTVFCGCTIISQYFVLTAAHCLTNRTIDTIGCVVGTTNYARAAESQFAATYQLLATEIYAGYDSVSMLNDIAIARVGPMEFNPAVSAVCLPIR